MHENWEIAFLCGNYNMVAYKFDLVVSRLTDRGQKSCGHNDRPTPGMLFPKRPVFHFAACSILPRLPLFYAIFQHCILDRCNSENLHDTMLLANILLHCGCCLSFLFHCAPLTVDANVLCWAMTELKDNTTRNMYV